MKVIIPVDENQQDVCVSFGRAPYFMLCDTQTKETLLMDNPAAKAEGGAGIKAAQLIVDHKADAIITVRCGENAADVLTAAKVIIYKAEGTNALANFEALAEGKLTVLDHFHAGFHGRS